MNLARDEIHSVWDGIHSVRDDIHSVFEEYLSVFLPCKNREVGCPAVPGLISCYGGRSVRDACKQQARV